MNELLQLRLSNNINVLLNEPLIFNQIVKSIGTIDYNDITGEITINKTGNYLINWWISTQTNTGSKDITFTLNVNGNIEDFSNSQNKTSTFPGVTYLNVDIVPTTITLINNTSNNVFLASTVEAKAEMLIYEINNNRLTESGMCYAAKQMAHVLEQIVDKYQGESAIIFTDRLTSITANIDSIYIEPDNYSGLFILVGGTEYVYYPISKLSAIYIGGVIYDNDITYLPDPEINDCTSNELMAIKNTFNIGDNISVAVGTNATGSGPIGINEYGVLVLLDQTLESPLFLFTINAFYIIKDTNNGLMNVKLIENHNHSL